jgi:hypothetical protein
VGVEDPEDYRPAVSRRGKHNVEGDGRQDLLRYFLSVHVFLPRLGDFEGDSGPLDLGGRFRNRRAQRRVGQPARTRNPRLLQQLHDPRPDYLPPEGICMHLAHRRPYGHESRLNRLGRRILPERF